MEYLLHHAEEEMLHWTWVIGDLRETGYQGADPRSSFPSIACQAYISYATYLGLKFPVGRLAMALILEGVSAKFGVSYGSLLAQKLSLSQNQVQFFKAHGELDQGHMADIVDLVSNVELTPYEWAFFDHSMKTTVELYKRMYNESMN